MCSRACLRLSLGLDVDAATDEEPNDAALDAEESRVAG
jgi:hypothetical protein